MNRVVGVVAAIITLFAGSLAALAAPTAPAAPSAQPAGQGLEISPPVIETTANPGQTVTVNIRLRNVTKGALVVHGKADDFGAKGEEGEPQLLLDETEATRYSLKFWVPSVPSFSLVPQEVKTAQVHINVPANAEPGGHYGVIRFTGNPPELEGTGVSLQASLGALVLLRVNGAITENLSTTEFYASHNGHRGWFFETAPVALTERLRNEGSVHVKPAGYVEVFDTFGKRVAQVPLSNPAHNVLPDSVRKFDQTLPNKSLFGRYTAKFSVTYGASNKTLKSSNLVFWVIPWRLILLILLGLVVLYFVLRWGIRRYNRYIIQQAKR